jgi:hypothetical protein
MKKRTFAEAKSEVLTALEKLHWAVVYTPAARISYYATRPDGKVRVYFTTSAAYYTTGEKHRFEKNLPLAMDIRTSAKEAVEFLTLF